MMFKVLERPQFSAAQSALFPVYFGMQSLLPVVMAVTYPGSGGLMGGPAGLAGVFDAPNRWTVLVPLALMASSGLLNLVVMLPAVKECMAARRAQEKKDGRKAYDPPPHSPEMASLNSRFGRLHGISSLLNLGTFLVTIRYAFTLAARFE
jgi:hypothetical protein